MDEKQLQSLLANAADHQKSGGYDRAIQLYDEALSIDPCCCDALHLKGLSLFQSGRAQEAVLLISKAIESNPRVPLFHFHLAKAEAASGDIDGACRSYSRAIELKPDYAEAYYDLGQTFARRGSLDAAEKCFKAVIHINRSFVDAWINLGNIEKTRGRAAEARAYFRQALAVEPDCYAAANNLGNLCLREGRLDEAASWYRRSLEARPGAVEPAGNLGSVLMRLGRFEEALEQLDAALSLQPEHPGIHFNKAWLLLLTERFEPGWLEYEWRLKTDGGTTAVRTWLDVSSGKLAWHGEGIAGRTILVHCEQGLGDTIQFSRYLPKLKENGAKVIFVCQKELMSLLVRGGIADLIIGEPEGGKVECSFDCHAALLSLPRLFGTGLSNIPSRTPYLHPGQERLAKWKSRIRGSRTKIGLVWAGRPANAEDWRRSCALGDYGPLAQLDDVDFYSLQKGPSAAQSASPPGDLKLIDIGPELDDFEDTAAAILQLDLVIAVDTAVAHLAGALAKPVWTVLPHFPEWRWLNNRKDSPWYPTMHLYRQPSPGDWRRVMERITLDLREFQSTRRLR